MRGFTRSRGYSFLVCVHGYVFPGWGYDVRTAATSQPTGHSLAVCFLGNDTAGRADVTPAPQRAHVEIARAISERYGRVMRYAGPNRSVLYPV